MIDVYVSDSNLHLIHLALLGPEGTPFAGGVYVMKILLPRDYPFSAPDFVRRRRCRVSASNTPQTLPRLLTPPPVGCA